MAERKVVVELESRYAGYVAGNEAATKATKKLKNETQQVDQNLKKIPPDAAKAAAAIKLLGGESAKASDKIDMLGRRGDVFSTLQVKLAAARAEVKRLALEFNATGDTSLVAAIMAANREIKQLERLTADLSRSAGMQASKAGMQAGGAFSDGFSSILMKTLPAAIPLVITAIVEALAASGGLILAAMPLGGIATGIFAQRGNTQVKAAASRAGGRLGSDVKYATDPIATATATSLDMLTKSLSKQIRATRADFEAMAPYEKMLAEYIGIAAERFMPKFSKALKEAGPVLGVLARDIPVIASAAGDFLVEISKGAKGGAESLDFMLRAVSMFIRGLGIAIHWSEDQFDKWLHGMDKVVTFLDKITIVKPPWVDFDKFHQMVGKIDDDYLAASTASDRFTASTYDSNAALTEQRKMLAGVVDKMNEYYDASMATLDANIAYQQAIDDLTDSLKKNGHNWDINTQKGRDNVLALKQVIDTAHNKYMDNLKKMDPTRAAEIYNGALKDLAHQASLTMAQLQKITGSEWVVNLRVHVEGSMGRVNDVLGRASQMRHGGVIAAASGTIVPDRLGPVVKFAEPGTGREGYVPQKGITHARAGALLGEMASWHGYGLTDGSRWRSGAGSVATLPHLDLTVQLVDAATGRVNRELLITDAIHRGVPRAKAQEAYP